jgi:hypothetical protein
MTQGFINKPHASAKDYERAFDGLEFPVAVHQVIRRAQDVGGLDREVDAILHKLPRDQYASVAELQGDIRAIYIAEGYPEDSLPF